MADPSGPKQAWLGCRLNKSVLGRIELRQQEFSVIRLADSLAEELRV
jgi:hypothetical protein